MTLPQAVLPRPLHPVNPTFTPPLSARGVIWPLRVPQPTRTPQAGVTQSLSAVASAPAVISFPSHFTGYAALSPRPARSPQRHASLAEDSARTLRFVPKAGFEMPLPPGSSCFPASAKETREWQRPRRRTTTQEGSARRRRRRKLLRLLPERGSLSERRTPRSSRPRS